jgi:hypothetical protein
MEETPKDETASDALLTEDNHKSRTETLMRQSQRSPDAADMEGGQGATGVRCNDQGREITAGEESKKKMLQPEP